MYYVYILENADANFHYTGFTHNLRKRFKKHTDGLVPVTKGYLPLTMVWHCGFCNKHRAALFEKYLKSGSGRAFIRKHLL